METIQDINFFTTYHCNSRCLNCNIWKADNQPNNQFELNEHQLSQLFGDPLFKSCTTVGLAGGEPTISPFFWRLLHRLPEDKTVTITTNALNSQKLRSFLAESKTPERYSIQLSLDGIGKVNDRIRGINGAYQKTLELLQFLQEHGIRRLISFTINQLNCGEIKACYELAQHFGAVFSTRMAYCGGAYDNLADRRIYQLSENDMACMEGQINEIIDQELTQPSHSPAQLVFLKNLPRYQRGHQKKITCLAMDSGLVIDLYGNVFPNCPVMMESVGTLHESSLSDIWMGDRARNMRRKIARFQCGGCWNDCQVVTNISSDTDFMLGEYINLKREWIDRQPRQDTIDFSEDQSAMVLTGWHAMEGDRHFRYRWTEPEFSFFIPPKTTRVELFALIPDAVGDEGSVGFRLELGGQLYHRRLAVKAGWATYSLTLPHAPSMMAACFLKMESGFCPHDSGNSDDLRRLGMAVGRIRFL